MSAARSRLRRALAVAVVGVFGVSGALVATTAAQAVPDAPVIFGPLDSTINQLTVEVDPAPSALEQTVTVSWELQETGAVGVGCQVVVPADTLDGTTFPCDAVVPDGQYGFYDLVAVSTDVDGDSPPSNTISSVRYGAAATPSSLELGPPLNVPDFPIRIGTLEPAISGTAPALGTVEVLGYRSDLGVGTESSLCLVSVPTSGAFSCPAIFPSYGIWEVRVIAQDVEGGFAVEPEAVESTLRLEVFPPTPTVDISTSFSVISAELTGLAGSNVGAAVVLDAYVAPTSGGFCPVAWDGNPAGPPADGPSVNCVVSDVTPGIHLVRSTQFLNGAASSIRDDVIYVAAAPTLAIDLFPGGATFSGTVDTLANELAASGTVVSDLFAVVQEGVNEVCGGAVDLTTGAWSCDAPLEPGDYSFAAYTFVQGFGDDPDVAGAVNGSYGTGATLSPAVDATIQASVTPPAPTMTYGLGAASIDVTAQGIENSAVGVRLYQVEEISGEGYQYGQAVASCGAVIEGEGEGFGSIVTTPSLVDDCLFSNLAPGIWNVYSSQNYYFEESEYRDDYVLIPPSPTLVATRAGIGQVTASGTGEPGHRVHVRQLGGAGSCTAVVDTGGDWSCAVSGVAGDTLLRAQQQSQGFEATPPVYFGLTESFDGYSAFTPTVFVAAVPAPPPPAAPPVAEPTPLPWVLEGYDGSPLTPGQQLSLSATGLPVGTVVVVEIRSTPQVLGSTVVGDTGVFALDVVVPDDLEPGEHTLVAIATPPGGVDSAVAIPVIVLEPVQPIDEAPLAEEPEAAEIDDGSSGAGGAGGAGDRSQPATPSAISDSIPTIERIFSSPLTIIVSGGLALAILLLVAFPAELLNSTLASNSRRLGRWYAAIENGVDRATEWFASVTRTRALAAALLVVLTSLIFGFVDPEYGFDPVSVRMTVSLAIGLFIVTYVSSWISGAIIRRVWSIETRVSLQPAALVFAVIGVVVARILEFSPGFLIGLVIGLDLVTRVGAPHRVRAILTNIGVIVGLAVASWIGFSIMSAVMTGEPTVVGLLVSDALVATTAEGLTAALAALLPLGFLDGHEVFRRSKLLWAGSFAAVATVFSLIVLPTAAGETDDVANVGFWMLVMVIFAAVTLTLWAILHFTARGESDDDELVEQPASAAR
ncbi:hypothetical protein [Microcella sp.]|uniref:hypothetical protein n=1 Tax=Microcella sp. TaxID=1913979 RepID=UPI00256BBEC5|nr:hypothetical protein [Microcella sp.]MBX9472933.1 hypothetical protein [Microcella sp.]